MKKFMLAFIVNLLLVAIAFGIFLIPIIEVYDNFVVYENENLSAAVISIMITAFVANTVSSVITHYIVFRKKISWKVALLFTINILIFGTYALYSLYDDIRVYFI